MTTSLAPQRSPAANHGWPPSVPSAPVRHIVLLSDRALLRDLLGLAFHDSGSRVTALHPSTSVMGELSWDNDMVVIIDGHGTPDPGVYQDLVPHAREHGTFDGKQLHRDGRGIRYSSWNVWGMGILHRRRGCFGQSEPKPAGYKCSVVGVRQPLR